jgi:HAD superfamily hydrolase (TIGR01509 family)
MDEKGLGARLQEVRREKGFTQQVLCQKANLSYSTLAKIERGAIKSPSIFTIQRLANILGIGLDDLLGNVTPTGGAKQKTSSGVSFVFFDVNGCLVRGYQRAFTGLAKETGALPDIIETLFWRYNEDVNRGTMSMSDLNQALSDRLGVSVDWAEAYLRSVEAILPMQDLLKQAAEKYRVGLFTNSMPGIVAALRQRGTLPEDCYEVIVDSSEIGVTKPDPKAYELAAQIAGAKPEEILLIDDTRNNLAAAERAGWHVLQYDGGLPEDSLERVRSALELSAA